jgi:hypothetical protein
MAGRPKAGTATSQRNQSRPRANAMEVYVYNSRRVVHARPGARGIRKDTQALAVVYSANSGRGQQQFRVARFRKGYRFGGLKSGGGHAAARRGPLGIAKL